MTSLVPTSSSPDHGSAFGRTMTLHLKVQPECWPWLDQAAREVNQVWNWANETSRRAVQTFAGPARWLSGFDLDKLATGAADEFDRIGADVIQRVNGEFVTRRRQFKKVKLRFRSSGGSKRSLGWIPFKGINLNLRRVKSVPFCDKKGHHQIQHKTGYRLTVMGKTIRLHQMDRLVQAWSVAESDAVAKETERLAAVKIEQSALEAGTLLTSLTAGKVIVAETGELQKSARRKVFKPALGSGSFAQNALGEWFLNVSVTVPHAEGTTLDATTGLPSLPPAPRELVGLDPGLKAVVTTSDGVRFEPNRSYRDMEKKIASAQRNGHKKQAKRLHAKAKNCRMNFTHQISHGLVAEYQTIKFGNVTCAFLQSGNHAKSALDSGWGMLKAQLHYKGHWAGRSVIEVPERDTTRACSSCGALTGPTGWTGLVVRFWTCVGCGVTHDRDVNAAINVAQVEVKLDQGSDRAKVLASVRGNKRDVDRSLCQPTQAIRNRDERSETISS